MILSGKQEKEGYITVYLSLSLLIMLSLIFTLIEGIRMQTIRFQTECVMDIGINSIFAEYHRELFEQYGMFAIDTTYGYEKADEDRTESHLLQYMNMNFTAPGEDRIPGYKDLTAITADNADLTRVSYLSDESGMVLKYQIIQYMKDKTGLSYVDSVIPKDLEIVEEKYHNLLSEWESNSGTIDHILRTLNENKAEEEERISIENPADRIEGMRESMLLSLVVKDGGTISSKQVSVSSLISHRSYKEGDGLWEDQEKTDGLINRTLFQMYLYEKCGYFHEAKEAGALDYQLEYMLSGESSDMENLEEMARKLLMIRFVANAAYLFSSPGKQAQATELAAVVTTSIMSPQLLEAVKITILFAWCYAESVQDVRILFDGKGVADVKSDATWNVPLKELLSFTTTLDHYRSVSEGRTYADYLKALLFMKEEKTVRMRLMDIMEMDIRQTAGNSYFKMDGCIYRLEAEVNVSSQYGYGYSIRRDYSYE